LIKDLKLKGSSTVLKRGTMIRGIHLTDNADEIEGRTNKVKGLVLRTEFLKKALGECVVITAVNRGKRGHNGDTVCPLRERLPGGQISSPSTRYLIVACPVPFAKIFLFFRNANQAIGFAVLSRRRGGSRSSRTRDRMRWTQAVRLTRALTCGRRSRVVLTPRRWCQGGGSNSAGDGGKKARSPGRARYKP
jgi:protein PhnA